MNDILDANAIFDAYQLIKESTMKIRLCLLIACLFSILVSSPVYAVHKAPLEAKSESITLKEGKKIKKIEKQLGKLESKIKKKLSKKALKGDRADVDFEDDVDKWMWFWIFGWGLGIVLPVLASVLSLGLVSTLIGLIGALAATFGTVSLVIWLVKKFS